MAAAVEQMLLSRDYIIFIISESEMLQMNSSSVVPVRIRLLTISRRHRGLVQAVPVYLLARLPPLLSLLS